MLIIELLILVIDIHIYKGIFFDTYNCAKYPTQQIKLKGTKFLKVNICKVASITDTSKDIKEFAFDEVLENYYEEKVSAKHKIWNINS